MSKTIYMLLLLLGVALTSCYRDDLCFYHPEGAVIELKIDWSKARLEPNSATAVIYKDGYYFRTEVFSVYPPVQKEIFLPVGKYSFVVFNEQRSDYERTLLFSGIDAFATLEGRTVDDYIANLLARSYTRSLKAEVDTLAVDRYLDFEVTPSMIPESHVDPTPMGQSGFYKKVYTINFLPQRVFTMVDILLKVKHGAGYFFTQRNPTELQGMAESYFLGKDRYSTSTVAHPLRFVQVPLQRGDTVQYRTSLQVVGLRDYLDTLLTPGAADYRVHLPFTYSGGIEVRNIDLRLQSTQFVYTPRYSTGRPQHHLFVEIELELEPLVNVGGMNANLEDWNEVDIPLDGPQRLHFLSNNGSKEAAWWPCTPGVEVNLLSPFFITPVANQEFREWNSLPDGTGVSYQPGDLYRMARGGAIFYAIWNRLDVPVRTLYFMANNGTKEEQTMQLRPGQLLPMPENSFMHPAGLMFKEWNSHPAGTGIAYFPNAPFRMKDEDMRFYAIWK